MLTAGQSQIAQLLYSLATQHGASPQHAREFAAASLAESGLNPRSVNRSSGATGLFQLLSQGYRQTARRLGGLNNPRANALAILPDYLNYWRSHPGAAPGQAGAAVERSGEGAGFYARPLSQLGQLGGGPATPSLGVRPHQGFATIPVPPQPPQPPQAPQAPDLTAVRQSLMNLATQRSPDYQPLFQQLQEAHAAQTPVTGNVSPSAPRMVPRMQPLAQNSKGQINELLLEGTGGPTHSTGPHVHAAMKTLGAQLAVEAQARRLGLNVGQNTDANTQNGVHAPHSYHKRDFPGSGHRMAADISGGSQAMKVLYRWIKTHYG